MIKSSSRHEPSFDRCQEAKLAYPMRYTAFGSICCCRYIKQCISSAYPARKLHVSSYCAMQSTQVTFRVFQIIRCIQSFWSSISINLRIVSEDEYGVRNKSSVTQRLCASAAQHSSGDYLMEIHAVDFDGSEGRQEPDDRNYRRRFSRIVLCSCAGSWWKKGHAIWHGT